MRVAVPRETDAGEPRVAATPETVKKLKSFGAEVAIARGAGIASGIPDSEFEAVGAQIADVVTKDADIVLKVRRIQERRACRRHHGSLWQRGRP
jgi:NAD(P) transhydrogenase subunit alpha